jgi:ABC-type antimicrobial peptide transport system ATPase subunit
LIGTLRQKKWIVYAKRPFAGPKQVLDYLGRYTHRVAISNHRIVALTDKKVTFIYRDRSDQNKKKAMCLDGAEFIRRFLMHVLPDRFVKIRYFGFMAHRNRKKAIALIRKLIAPDKKFPEKIKETVIQMIQRVMGIDITRCPVCNSRLIALPLDGVTECRARAPT